MPNDGFTVENAVWVRSKLPPWWLVLIEGILLILIAIFLLTNPYRTFAAIIWVLGFYWLIRGLLDLVSLIWDRTMWGWKMFAGILGVVAGWIILQYPAGSAAVIANVFIWLLGFIGIFIGISSLIRGFRGAGWGTLLLGAIEIVLGLLLLFDSGTFASWLPWVMAFFAGLGGIGALIGAFQLRGVENRLDDIIET